MRLRRLLPALPERKEDPCSAELLAEGSTTGVVAGPYSGHVPLTTQALRLGESDHKCITHLWI